MRSTTEEISVAGLFFCCEVREMEYIELLKQDLADENETVRKYLATLAKAPEGASARLLEIMADELDHIAIVSDLLLEAAAGESADQETLIPGVK